MPETAVYGTKMSVRLIQTSLKMIVHGFILHVELISVAISFQRQYLIRYQLEVYLSSRKGL